MYFLYQFDNQQFLFIVISYYCMVLYRVSPDSVNNVIKLPPLNWRIWNNKFRVWCFSISTCITLSFFSGLLLYWWYNLRNRVRRSLNTIMVQFWSFGLIVWFTVFFLIESGLTIMSMMAQNDCMELIKSLDDYSTCIEFLVWHSIKISQQMWTS